MTGKKVLIVDDDPDILLGLKIRLTKSGYDVVFAMDGVTAMSMVRKESPDVIILDLGLPAGNGFKVMEHLKKQLSTIPVIVLTGSSPHLNLDKSIEAGAMAFLQKPIDDDRLLITIEQALHS